MAMIFVHLRIPPQFQHRVLFWGILGALFMRGVMIVVGVALVARYHWILYVFGAFLVYTAIEDALSRRMKGTSRRTKYSSSGCCGASSRSPGSSTGITSRRLSMAAGCSRRSPWASS